LLALAHGVFYLITGLWPVIHMRSFVAVSGPKVDLWLVRTVGLLLGAIGGTLTLAGWRGRAADPTVPLLAVGTAGSLAGIDIVYWKRGRLWPIYLADAGGELALIACWAAGWIRNQKTAR
jgi:hypothetical protein